MQLPRTTPSADPLSPMDTDESRTMDATAAPRQNAPRRLLGAALTAVAAAAMVMVAASPAAAHHGWDGFETNDLVYIAGTVSSDGSWGEPHLTCPHG